MYDERQEDKFYNESFLPPDEIQKVWENNTDKLVALWQSNPTGIASSITTQHFCTIPLAQVTREKWKQVIAWQNLHGKKGIHKSSQSVDRLTREPLFAMHTTTEHKDLLYKTFGIWFPGYTKGEDHIIRITQPKLQEDQMQAHQFEMRRRLADMLVHGFDMFNAQTQMFYATMIYCHGDDGHNVKLMF